MLFAANGLIGFPVAAGDGRIGAVKDFLIDDRSWEVRWMVVDTGHWLPGRRVLIPASAVAPIPVPQKSDFPMLAMVGGRTTLSVNLTIRQIMAGADAPEGAPAHSPQPSLFDYYGLDPSASASSLGEAARRAAKPAEPALGSAAAIRGMSVRGPDGRIGSVDNAFIDDGRWTVRFLVVAARGWLRRKLVEIPLSAVTAIDRQARTVTVEVTRERVESAPAWDPLRMNGGMADPGPSSWFGAPEA